MKGKITATEVAKLAKGGFIYDIEIRGFRAVRLPSGRVTFGYHYTGPDSKRRYLSLGLLGAVTAAEARVSAKRYAGEVAGRGNPAVREREESERSKNTINHVLDQWIQKHARPNIRRPKQVDAYFERFVRPAIGDVAIYDLQREQVVALLDDVAEMVSAVTADAVLTYLRAAIEWWRVRDSNFSTMPIVRGLRQTKTEDRARDRFLSTQELRDLWAGLAAIEAKHPVYCAIIRCILYSGCRVREIADMHTREIDGHTWTIPKARYKTKREHAVPLVPALRRFIPKTVAGGFVFSSDGGARSFNSFSGHFESTPLHCLRIAIADIRKRGGREPMPYWQLRDLRRTARTYLAKAGVPSDIAERVLGHAQPGPYDRDDYLPQKTEALIKLGEHLDRLIHSDPAAVVELRRA